MQVVGTGTDLQPIREALDYDSRHAGTRKTRKGYAPAGKLSTQNPNRTMMQHGRNAHYTSRQLYKHYTVNYCVSQMGSQTKNSHSLQSEM